MLTRVASVRVPVKVCVINFFSVVGIRSKRHSSRVTGFEGERALGKVV